ncbi:MAG TPA: HAD family phosphatase [Terriglobales bacterium]|nr:HAD family phosphatase [Terriglobales bacterium]
MPKISAIFWDLGGVLLTNAWDHNQRRQAMEKFQLDQTEFEDRHEMLASSFERGKINLADYLERTVFYRDRPFTIDAFREFMYSLSLPNNEALAIARSLAASGKYFMGTINNESMDLNDYRIAKFGLRDIFDVFVSSCFVRLRKPDEAIYRVALEVTQMPAAQCCFIDDRELNLDAAKRLGMSTIRMQNAQQLQEELTKLGVSA